MVEKGAESLFSSRGDVQVPEAVAEDDVKASVDDTNTVQASSSSSSLLAILQSSVDRALTFLAHASNETLGACLVGLGASTYLILGRVGLVIIGVAGGVVLHATWDGLRGDNRDEATKRLDQEKKREAGVEVAKRLLDWRASMQREEESRTQDTKVHANQRLDFSQKFGPEATAALEAFTESAIKDYVHYWYDPTIPDEGNFPAACTRTLKAFILSLSGHVQRRRPADAFLDFATNSSSIIIVFLNELAVALNASPNSPANEAVATYLELKPDSSLAYMLDEEAQKQKLADMSEEILQAYLDHKAYNFPPVHLFLKEVLAQLVLESTVALCSRPEWINDWIVYGLEESETTKEVMEIVDAGVNKSTRSGALRAADPVVGVADTDNRQNMGADSVPAVEHKRTRSKAEDSMEEAMREARRLTELMLAEDERRIKEESERSLASSSGEDISDATSQETSQETPTPTSSQSGHDRQSADATMESLAAEEPTPTTPPKQPFTSFDQILPQTQVTALIDSPKHRTEPAVLTLHNANINIFDDSNPNERTSMKSKPTIDYLIQIEPASSAFAGWMIARKYTDFEMLHEVLRRISVITGVKFAHAHAELPKWKAHTKASLRTELERYLIDAVRFQPLAESEGMKRFLEKDQGMAKSPGGGMKGFGWPTPDAFGKLGGDMMNVLTKGPRQVAGGVAGLVAGGKKANTSQTNLGRSNTNSTIDLPTSPTIKRSSMQPLPIDGSLGSICSARASQDSLRSIPQAAFDRRESNATSASVETRPKLGQRPSSMLSQDPATLAEVPMASSLASLPDEESFNAENIVLPPPPSEMPEDYGSLKHIARMSTETSGSFRADPRSSISMDAHERMPSTPPKANLNSAKGPETPKEPLTERETSVAIELMFAVITELYTLSSAWQIRRTLLTAAKTFLLRPGNPQLLSIRDLLQTSLLDANLNDSGLAHQIYELRKNGLPTAEELEVWNRDYPEKTAEQKEELRVKARRLLVTKGMPQALTSVMGTAASGEALGKVFDCLQIPAVSRGLIFGLMVQALHVVTH